MKCNIVERTTDEGLIFDVVLEDYYKAGEIRNITRDYPAPTDHPFIGYCFWPEGSGYGPETLRMIAEAVELIKQRPA